MVLLVLRCKTVCALLKKLHSSVWLHFLTTALEITIVLCMKAFRRLNALPIFQQCDWCYYVAVPQFAHRLPRQFMDRWLLRLAQTSVILLQIWRKSCKHAILQRFGELAHVVACYSSFMVVSFTPNKFKLHWLITVFWGNVCFVGGVG